MRLINDIKSPGMPGVNVTECKGESFFFLFLVPWLADVFLRGRVFLCCGFLIHHSLFSFFPIVTQGQGLKRLFMWLKKKTKKTVRGKHQLWLVQPSFTAEEMVMCQR